MRGASLAYLALGPRIWGYGTIVCFKLMEYGSNGGVLEYGYNGD